MKNFIFPPGYRFRPTDEELVVYYLSNKIMNNPLPYNYDVIELNLYDYHPQQLYDLHMREGETAMYFFSPRERKYPHGNRPKRKAGEGYWKACGTGSPIIINNIKVASKRVLVYYTGDNKNSVKTNWIMYEYVMEQHSIPALIKPNNFNKGSQIASSSNTVPVDSYMKLDDWVLCKIYEKTRKSKNKNEEDSINVSSELQIQTNADNSTSSPASMQTNIDEVNSTHHHVGCHDCVPQWMQGTHQDLFDFNNFAPQRIHQFNLPHYANPPLLPMPPMFGNNFDMRENYCNVFSTDFAPGTQNGDRYAGSIGVSPPSTIQPTLGSRYIPFTRPGQPFMLEHQDYGCTNTVPVPLIQNEFIASNDVGSSSSAPAMQGTNGGDATDSGFSTNSSVQILVAGAPLIQRTDDQCNMANSDPVVNNNASVFPQFDKGHHPDLPYLEGKKSDSPK